eukprot:TRINITY_DN4975_c1_g3_i1.p1 TRINITY_DN4975_c1_g3~~TRINITY_DN4975_c1_g3_i1.p1  ORF type:complete len:363 (+),score=47.13 TRINITY_DN4975_c1_g3_i1:75-1091(+)
MASGGGGGGSGDGVGGSRSAKDASHGSGGSSVTAAERCASVLVGYCFGAVTVLPFDRVKSLMQVAAQTGAPRQSAFAVAKNVIASQGLRGIYKGGVPHMCIAPYTIFYYSIYDELLVWGRGATSSASAGGGGGVGHPLVPLAAAVCARTLETSLRMPFELVRTMMQTSGSSVTLTGCLRSLARQPPSAWFRGMVPTLFRDVPFSAIYWFGYEEAKLRLTIPETWIESRSMRTWAHSFMCGAASGMVSAILIAPVDVIKTVRQHNIEVGVTSGYSGILKTLRAHPSRAFAGLGPRLVRIPLGMATMMSGLELTRHLFERRRQLRSEEGGGVVAAANVNV